MSQAGHRSGAGQEARRFDLVLLGATGFVGRLTAQHLARYAPAGMRVALAGRSRERLEAVRSELGGSAAGWPLVVVDVREAASVHDLAGSTRVLLTTVGPYLRHGLPVVRACAATGTAYADLTGETLFVRRSIDAAHERARATGARIVHACGFDSVPSDLGVGLTAARAAADGAGTLTDTVLHVRSTRGGGGGGAGAAAAVAGGTAGLVAGLAFGPTRALLDRLLPAPGTGPSEATLQQGRFTFDVVAGTASGARYRTRVAARRDPGYLGTAVMLGESGLALAADDLPDVAGVLTPMVALGETLAERLRRHDFTVETVRLG